MARGKTTFCLSSQDKHRLTFYKVSYGLRSCCSAEGFIAVFSSPLVSTFPFPSCTHGTFAACSRGSCELKSALRKGYQGYWANVWIVLLALWSNCYEQGRGTRAWPPSAADRDINLDFARLSAFDQEDHQVKTEPDREGGAGKTHWAKG